MSLLKKVSSSSKRIKSLKDMLIKKGSEVKKTPSLIAKRSEVTEPSEMVARKAEAKHFPSSAEKSSTYTNVTTVFQTEQPSSVLHDTANGKLEPVKSPNKTLQLESGFDQQFGHDHVRSSYIVRCYKTRNIVELFHFIVIDFMIYKSLFQRIYT